MAEKEIAGDVSVHFRLVNFIFNGCEKSNMGDSGFKIDKFTVKINGTIITFKQLSDYERKERELNRKGGKLETSEAICPAEL